MGKETLLYCWPIILFEVSTQQIKHNNSSTALLSVSISSPSFCDSYQDGSQSASVALFALSQSLPGNSQHILCPEPGQREIRKGSKGPRHKGPAACRTLALHRRKRGSLNILDTCDPSFYSVVVPNGKLVEATGTHRKMDFLWKRFIENICINNYIRIHLNNHNQVAHYQPVSLVSNIPNDNIWETKARLLKFYMLPLQPFVCVFCSNQFPDLLDTYRPELMSVELCDVKV